MQSWLVFTTELLLSAIWVCFFPSRWIFFSALAEDVPPSTLPPAQHIWWDIIWGKWRACLNCESCCLLVKPTISSRESHPPDLVFPGKSRCFTGRKEKYREPWKWFWSSSRNFGAEKGGGLQRYSPRRKDSKKCQECMEGGGKWHYSSDFAIMGGGGLHNILELFVLMPKCTNENKIIPNPSSMSESRTSSCWRSDHYRFSCKGSEAVRLDWRQTSSHAHLKIYL